MKSIRLIKLGQVPPVRSQTVYHAVAYTFREESPNTIILVSPSAPYVCIGYHQDLDKEVDLDYCREHGLPVYRREVGGGAVYLDSNQTFIQWVFHAYDLPASLDTRFELYIRPLLKTYHALSIDAVYRPVNDIHVSGRKIGGTGAAQIGAAEVLVGSLMFDFDKTTMSRILKIPSEKMRDKVFESLEQYMTTIREQAGHDIDHESVRRLYLCECARALDADLVPGCLTVEEETIAAQLDATFAADEWLWQRGGLRTVGVKIHEDVKVLESTYKAPGGIIRATVRIRDDRIDDLTISGDFTIIPAIALSALEQSIRGVRLSHEQLLPRLSNTYRSLNAQSPGLAPEDFVQAIMGVRHA